MADPSGITYCLTARQPNTGRLPTKSGLVTVEELKAAKAALIESMPGWTPPAAYACDSPRKRVRWSGHINNRGVHGFPAVALSKVLGYRAGSASFPMDLRTFDEVIDVLRPAWGVRALRAPELVGLGAAAGLD